MASRPTNSQESRACRNFSISLQYNGDCLKTPQKVTRRAWLAGTSGSLLAIPTASTIDRRGLVRRHNPVLRDFDPRSPLSVGNGEFAFTVDVTGLQTCPELYEASIPLCTQSQWGWHSFPHSGNLELRLAQFETYGRMVGYPTSAEGQKELFVWLRQN